MKTAYDVVILGGGPAGCATALALKQNGASSVLVVEAGNYEKVRVGESIPPDTRLLLEKLDVWDCFLEEQYERCLGSASSWGGDELGYNDFLFNPIGFGWHLDRRRFDKYLAKCVEAQGVDLLTYTRFTDYDLCEDASFNLSLFHEVEKKETSVKARFVVDATGSKALFARSMGGKRQIYDQLTCVYGFFETPFDSYFSKLTILEAVEYGWWYGARLPDGQLAIALTTDAGFFKQEKLQNWKYWLTHLSETVHISQRLAGCGFDKDSLLIVSVVACHMDKVIGDGWLAVGDAASTFDPISAQGIHKALTDSLKAAETIVSCLQGNFDKADDYRVHIANQYANYLKNRNYFYSLENRWPESSFWKNRQKKISLEFQYALQSLN